MTLLAITYATDEDIAIRAPGDFPILAPKDQMLAAGADGAFAPGAPWVLTSASSDFAAQGVAAGNVVLLTKPVTSFKPPGQVLVAATVAGGALTLRRKATSASGKGMPPAPAAGLTGVEFAVPTLFPQIEEATDDLNRLLGINELIVNRGAMSLTDRRELRQATVLKILYKLYLDASRQAGSNDDFVAKAKIIAQEYTDLLARLVVHWQSITSSYGGAAETVSTRFNMRLSR